MYENESPCKQKLKTSIDPCIQLFGRHGEILSTKALFKLMFHLSYKPIVNNLNSLFEII
jgi:hypothetical protein